MYRAGAFDPIVSRSSNYRLPPNFILDLFFLNRDSFFIGMRENIVLVLHSLRMIKLCNSFS